MTTSNQNDQRRHLDGRGKVLRIDHDRRIEPFAHEPRFPRIAIDGQDRLFFVSDQQGVANTFNEINYIVQGRHYGEESA
ncbi:MAG: hypothetical protein R3C02_05700 [Planctomycetaceae bacterium]